MSHYLRNLIQRAKGGSAPGAASAPMVSARPAPLFSAPTPIPPAANTLSPVSPQTVTASLAPAPSISETLPSAARIEPAAQPTPLNAPAQPYVSPAITELSAAEAAQIVPRPVVTAPQTPTSERRPQPDLTTAPDLTLSEQVSAAPPVRPALSPAALPRVTASEPSIVSTSRTESESSADPTLPTRRVIAPAEPVSTARTGEPIEGQAPSREPMRAAPRPLDPAINPAPITVTDESAPSTTPPRTSTPVRIEPRSLPVDVQLPRPVDSSVTAPEAPSPIPVVQITPRAFSETIPAQSAPQITPLNAPRADVSAERQSIILPNAPTVPPVPARPVKRSVEVHIGSLEVRFDAPEPPSPRTTPPAPPSAPRPNFDEYAARRSYREAD